MTKQEFINATYFIPTSEEWEHIQRIARNVDLTSIEFCNSFKSRLRFGNLKDEFLAWRLHRITELEEIIDRMSQKTAEVDHSNESIIFDLLNRYSKAEGEAEDYKRELKAIEKAMTRIFAGTEEYDIVLASIEKILEEYEEERRLRREEIKKK